MTTLEIVELVAISIAIVAILVWISVKAVKNKWLAALSETIKKAIKDAETTGKSGAEKKAYVLQRIEEKCDELGIPFRLVVGLVSRLIDTIVKHYNVIVK